MHRKANPNRKRAIMIIGGALAVVIAACLVVIFTMSSSHGATPVQSVAQPASAAQIAKGLNCVQFKDDGAAAILSNDSGNCYIGGKKYAINTFPDQGARDAWLKSATQLGVVPKWENATSVVYPSVD